MTSRRATSFEDCAGRNGLDVLRRKLVSERGASLSMALLFVVICSAIAFVIVTAATGLAGRATQVGGEATREELDQRQYVLRSAAQLVKEQIEGQCVCAASVQYDDNGTATKVYYVSSDTSNTWSSIEPAIVAAQEAVAAGSTPSVVTDLEPGTALEYLAAQYLGYEYSDSGLMPKNYWNVETATVGTQELISGYSFPYASATTDPDYFEITLAATNQSAQNVIDALGAPRCTIEADERLNLTLTVFFASDHDNDSQTSDKVSASIQMYLPATTSDYPEETSSTIPEGTTTEYTSVTDRMMVTW